MKTILCAVLLSCVVIGPISFAQTVKKIECTGPYQFGDQLYQLKISAAVGSVNVLRNLVEEDSKPGDYFLSTYPHLSGDGTTFYLHSGNTATYIYFPSGRYAFLAEATVDDVKQAQSQGSHKYDFPAQYIFESFEEPGAGQIIGNLNCMATVQ